MLQKSNDRFLKRKRLFGTDDADGHGKTGGQMTEKKDGYYPYPLKALSGNN